MAQNSEITVKENGNLDLNKYTLNDRALIEILQNEYSIPKNQAMIICDYIRKTIDTLKVKTITTPVIDEILKLKLIDFGFPKISSIKLQKDIFIKNGLELSDNAKTVLKRRYLKKDNKGKALETPAQMFHRVANHIALAESNYSEKTDIKKIEEQFYEIMTEFKFLPNSPTLMNAGRQLGQLAACFVLPVDDSMEGIFDSLKHAAIIHKSGGGTGFSFSRLRPKQSVVGTTGGIASGPVSFMKIFNTATEQVKQGGTRRGANMAILRVDHPDITEFITCKKEHSELNNFNISVGLTETFMAAVRNRSKYDLINPHDREKVGELDAVQVYQNLVQQAWENGDPGIIFLDRLNRDNPTPALGEIESTNPCGEQPLLPMEACNLGSINLSKFVTQENNETTIDYESLKQTVHTAVRFLDNTIDMSKYPLSEIDLMVKGNRKIGLGVMGFADLLYQMKIPYHSEEALTVAEEVMKFVQKESLEASIILAQEREPFINYDQSIFKEKGKPGIRNATTTTIAPTGTLSILASCSSGVEPLFALSYVRNVMDNDKLLEVNRHFEKVAKERGFYSDDLMNEIANKGSIQGMKQIPQDVRDVFVTAHDIAPEWHVRMQAAFQKYTDNAVSKTVNLPHDSTVEDVLKIYNLAYELDCKGVTIYRDGSKENQVLSISNQQKASKGSMIPIMKRPETLNGFTTKIKTGYGHLYVTVTEFDGQPFEIFATIGKSGRSTTAKTEAIGRLVSLALRSGVKVGKIVDQLKGIGGEHPVFQEGGLVLSIPDAIATVLEKHYIKKDGKRVSKHVNNLMGETCPECGETISFEEGCMTCHFCGFTKCG